MNLGLWVAGAAIGVWGGVKAHGTEIAEIKRRLERIEGKQDAMLNHFAIKGIEGDDD